MESAHNSGGELTVESGTPTLSLHPPTPLEFQQGQPGNRYRATDIRNGLFWQTHFD